jgi:tetraacyldisaccharide 4'-kinase
MRLRRGWEPVRRLRFPVVSVGNLSTGGAGKTPFAIALAKALNKRGFTVDVLSRGYGRTSAAPARVNPGGTAEEFGDEPLLIAREAGVPVYVARERYEAGMLAEAEPAQGEYPPRIHILDDGFQHRQLHRDVNVLLLNRDDWHDRLLPAGNLREPRAAANRADVIAVSDGERGVEGELRAWGWKGPVWRLRRRMEIPAVPGPFVAFCGIARREQFFAGLEAAGLPVAKRIAFRDHHRYTAGDVERLLRAARAEGAGALVTTRKDEVRLRLGIAEGLSAADGGPWFPTLSTKTVERMRHEASVVDSRSPIMPFFTARLRVEIEDSEGALDWLEGRLRHTEVRPSV